MTRSIAVGVAILAISTSTAFAGHRTHHHHAKSAAVAAPVVWPGSSDQALHIKNHRDSSYSQKSDYNANGTMRTQDAGASPGSSKQAHVKNHRDAGYSPKSDYNANGTMRVH